jgi:hypothetical protein
LGLRARVRAFFKPLFIPPGRLGPNERRRDRPFLAIPATIGILVLEWIYVYIYLPYDSISDKTSFWFLFVAWATPPALVAWAYRIAPARRYDAAVSKLFIGIGLLGIVLSGFRGGGVILTLVQALFPGVLAGGLVGSDAALLWKIRKGQLAK